MKKFWLKLNKENLKKYFGLLLILEYLSIVIVTAYIGGWFKKYKYSILNSYDYTKVIVLIQADSKDSKCEYMFNWSNISNIKTSNADTLVFLCVDKEDVFYKIVNIKKMCITRENECKQYKLKIINSYLIYQNTK